MTLPETVFLLLLFVACLGYLGWGFKNLPEESRQMLAAIPVHKREDGTWTGLNITWYGLLTANAVSASAALFILLNGSLGWNTLNGFLLVAWIMTLALPAARIIARVIERKANTFTTGGAFAVGLAAVDAVAEEQREVRLGAHHRELPVVAELVRASWRRARRVRVRRGPRGTPRARHRAAAAARRGSAAAAHACRSPAA